MTDRTDTSDVQDESPLAAAARRLERAVGILEGRVGELSTKAEGSSGQLFDIDRSQLASDLDDARARERELKEAGAEASQALGQAIAGLKRALDQAEAG